MNTKDVIASFEQLDYFDSIYHSRIMAVLISSPLPITAKEIAQRLDLPDSKVYPTLVDLEDLTLVKVSQHKRPKQYYFETPHNLDSFLRDRFRSELTTKEEIIERLVNHANQLWEPSEFEMDQVARLYRGDDIARELLRHIKLSKDRLFMLLSTQIDQYIPVLVQALEQQLSTDFRLDIAIPESGHSSDLRQLLSRYDPAKIRVKQSLWTQSSYIIRDRKVMMNILHSSKDVAMVTNDNLLVQNIQDCWHNPNCCSTDLIELEIR